MDEITSPRTLLLSFFFTKIDRQTSASGGTGAAPDRSTKKVSYYFSSSIILALLEKIILSQVLPWNILVENNYKLIFHFFLLFFTLSKPFSYWSQLFIIYSIANKTIFYLFWCIHSIHYFCSLTLLFLLLLLWLKFKC